MVVRQVIIKTDVEAIFGNDQVQTKPLIQKPSPLMTNYHQKGVKHTSVDFSDKKNHEQLYQIWFNI